MNKFIVMVAAGVLLAGCTASKPSPERHAIAFTENHSSTDGGVRFSPQGTYRNIIPTFEKMYDQGKLDRIVGHDVHYAIKYAGMLKEQAGRHLTETYDRTGDKMPADPKDADSIGNELSATYLDGYNGVY
ncbi:hypothetical protein B2M27_09260 [Kluyvera intermedia]|mgnify:FL=1|jgi:hypothetical protein|uniref:Exc2 family lipoprotein n=1 Tax=Kluyvera intermedia TaxID=61648 RepID=A0ABX3UGV8_KLUIN|nr:Exc2 family lipoprotein [Kluyvera intermedia]ORJ50743.1 hypothetical protein B2M27_09260 [Kluyvera intermedia]